MTIGWQFCSVKLVNEALISRSLADISERMILMPSSMKFDFSASVYWLPASPLVAGP